MTIDQANFHKDRCPELRTGQSVNTCPVCALQTAVQAIEAAERQLSLAAEKSGRSQIMQLRNRVHIWRRELDHLAAEAFGEWLKQFRVGLTRSAAKNAAEEQAAFPNGRWS